MPRRFAFPLCLIAAAATSAAYAQMPAPDLTVAAARAIAEGCVAHATSKRQSHAIAVTDTGGHLILALRMDGNGHGIMDFAIAKAEAAAAWGFATEDMEKGAAATPGFARAPHVVTVGGGVPVYNEDGSRRIGAVGVSGEAVSDDISCAQAGIAAAGLRSTRAAR